MAKQVVFVIYDDKAKAYLPPFFLPEMGMGVRTFGDCVNQVGHPFFMHPSDYTLFAAGTFDDRSGKFEMDSTLLCVAHGHELKKTAMERAAEGGQEQLPLSHAVGGMRVVAGSKE